MISTGSKVLLLILVTVSILIFGILLIQHFDNEEKIHVSQQSLKGADITVKDLIFIQTRRGEVEWEIRAKSAELFDDSKQTVVSDVRVFLKTEQGSEIRFHGDRGLIDIDQYDFTIENREDDMKVEIDNDYTILTRKLEWSNTKREMIADQPVRIEAPLFSIKGGGLLVRTLGDELSIIKGVHATIHQ